MAIDNTGKIAYIYQDGTWYAISGAVNTAGAYTWTGTQNFANTVTFESVVKAEGGINNFQNYTARDAAIPAPTNGVVVFVRQDNAGNVINQLQYYKNGSWVSINDVVIDAKTSNYSLQTFDSGKLITVSSSSDVVISVPANSAQPFPVGTTIDIARMGSGDVTITPASGAIIYSKGDYLDIAYQYGIVKLTKLDTNSWLLTGDLIVQGVPTTTTTTTAAPTTTTTAATTAATTGATTTTTSGGGGTTTTTTTEATTTTTQQTSGGTPPQTTTTTEPTTASPTYTYFCTTKENTGDIYSFTNETDASGCVSGVANTICVYAPVGSNSYPAAPPYPCSTSATTTTTTTTTTAAPTTTTTTGASTTTTTTCSGNYVYSQNGTSSNWGCASGTANVIYWYDECNNVVDEIFVSCVPSSTTTTTAAPTTTTTAAPVTTTTTAAPVTTTTTAAPVTTTTTAAPTTTASSGCTTPEPIPGECFCMNGSWAC